MSECFICEKHRNFGNFAGQPLLKQQGLILGHFPIIEGAPAVRGHLLIEPERHILDMAELSDQEAAALGALCAKGSALLKRELGAEHVYLFRINDKVPHLHFHLVPRYAGTPREHWGTRIMEWPGASKIGLEEIAELSQNLRARIAS